MIEREQDLTRRQSETVVYRHQSFTGIEATVCYIAGHVELYVSHAIGFHLIRIGLFALGSSVCRRRMRTSLILTIVSKRMTMPRLWISCSWYDMLHEWREFPSFFFFNIDGKRRSTQGASPPRHSLTDHFFCYFAMPRYSSQGLPAQRHSILSHFFSVDLLGFLNLIAQVTLEADKTKLKT